MHIFSDDTQVCYFLCSNLIQNENLSFVYFIPIFEYCAILACVFCSVPFDLHKLHGCFQEAVILYTVISTTKAVVVL